MLTFLVTITSNRIEGPIRLGNYVQLKCLRCANKKEEEEVFALRLNLTTNGLLTFAATQRNFQMARCCVGLYTTPFLYSLLVLQSPDGFPRNAYKRKRKFCSHAHRRPTSNQDRSSILWSERAQPPTTIESQPGRILRRSNRTRHMHSAG
ncbi:hypothetical protein BRADI_4g33131v3 [Brachypodium distachyon]|uniref:Uncharacterized protein n=1 Tax=Brachypodium distachyon TaxID=15368 RepID=A0A2K2CS12_BRADI|nr:hypothetical protein BRADI_4g33131v3 [Brachypodium distachyon]